MQDCKVLCPVLPPSEAPLSLFLYIYLSLMYSFGREDWMFWCHCQGNRCLVIEDDTDCTKHFFFFLQLWQVFLQRDHWSKKVSGNWSRKGNPGHNVLDTSLRSSHMLTGNGGEGSHNQPQAVNVQQCMGSTCGVNRGDLAYYSVYLVKGLWYENCLELICGMTFTYGSQTSPHLCTFTWFSMEPTYHTVTSKNTGHAQYAIYMLWLLVVSYLHHHVFIPPPHTTMVNQT